MNTKQKHIGKKYVAWKNECEKSVLTTQQSRTRRRRRCSGQARAGGRAWRQGVGTDLSRRVEYRDDYRRQHAGVGRQPRRYGNAIGRHDGGAARDPAQLQIERAVADDHPRYGLLALVLGVAGALVNVVGSAGVQAAFQENLLLTARLRILCEKGEDIRPAGGALRSVSPGLCLACN